MNEEKIKQLLDYLASLGFNDSRLHENVREKISQNLPQFTEAQKIYFGEELMVYDLRFTRDKETDAYRLKEFKATHWPEIKVDHKIINRIDTYELEEKMRIVNWDSYFGLHRNDLSRQILQNAESITHELNELSKYDEGRLIQEQLLVKYFPSLVVDPKLHSRITSSYSHFFIAGENGISNANLAYHTVSGRLDDILGKIEATGIIDFTRRDLYTIVGDQLSVNPKDFTIVASRNKPEGYTSFSLPVKKNSDGFFDVDTYKLTFTPYPEIAHGVFNGIDTRTLERQMRSIDWGNDYELFVFHADREPDLQPKVAEVQEMIYRLSQDNSGTEIADRLQAKYWSEATFFEDMVSQKGWDYLHSLPKITQEFPAQLDAQAAFNLLCGRAILEQVMFPDKPDTGNWIRLDKSIAEPGKQIPLKIIPGFPRQDLERLIRLLPTELYLTDRKVVALSLGNCPPAKLAGGKTVLLEANPENKTINFYTMEMRSIAVNIHFDPDWKPKQQQILYQREQKVLNKPIPKVASFIKKSNKKGKRI